MKELTIPPDALRLLLEQLRSVEVPVESDDGGNDLRRNELQTEIEGLDRDQQHELVALLWIGRGDYQEVDWDEAKALAEERHVGPTFEYLASHPQAADHIAAGLEEIGHEHLLLDGEY
ncbi:DUF3775 domain-containing protein [Jannaschia aquimarina]|uniref:DUF3775 domain-containing protein n=1 Tax=Jannaschia aquimarina TaxID=935700 RepID=A0A0D1EEM3_9RHOB|nr:DUF3775 domain-containing protein [Jannaschia aquimarina]KIT14315.1 hypothetical protein jaqu_39050 [Jannaschia aquimarina]SNS85891.1 Protein of unknown function [Jannaschia aquimarina]